MKRLFYFMCLVTKKILTPICVLGGGFSIFAALAWVIGFISLKLGVPVAKGNFIDHPNLGTGMAVISFLALVFMLGFGFCFCVKCSVTSIRLTWQEAGNNKTKNK
jgi:hypothetical protein